MMSRRRWGNPRGPAVVGVAVAVLAAGVSSTPAASALPVAPPSAHADLRDTSGAERGRVLFIEEGTAVVVQVDVSGLTEGWHGFHVHTRGDCSVGDPANPFTGAGGHLGSGDRAHGSHGGDLPALYANASGWAQATFRTDRFTLAQLLDADGSAVIVHADPDNLANIPADPTRYRRAPFGAGDVGADAETLATGDSGLRRRCGAVAGGSRAVTPYGYWVVTADGRVFPAGVARSHGSADGTRLNRPVVGMTTTPSGNGYRLVAGDGGVFSYGDAGFHGSPAGTVLNRPVVGMGVASGQASTVLRDIAGRPLGTVRFTQESSNVRVDVHAEGLADGWHGFHVHDVGSCEVGDAASPFAAAGGHLASPTLGRSHGGHGGDMPVLYSGGGVARATFRTDGLSVAQLLDANGSAVIVNTAPDNLASIPADGSRYRRAPFGPADVGPDAGTLSSGDSGGRQRCGVVQRTGEGYWLVAGDGGVFAYGDARFFGSAGAVPLNQPVAAMAATPSGEGYWLVAADGGVFAYGDAGFFGSAAGLRLAAPVVGIAATASGRGYWLTAADGGVFAFGDAIFYGSLADSGLTQPVVAIASTPTGIGYYLFDVEFPGAWVFGDAVYIGVAGAAGPNDPVRGGAVHPG